MEAKDHLLLGRYLLADRGIPPEDPRSKRFLQGIVWPDINVLTYIAGHTFRDSFIFIAPKIKRLHKINNWDLRDFFECGKVFHYLADYFTFPHNDTFRGGLRKHRAYERELHLIFETFLAKYKPPKKANPQDLVAMVEKYHDVYEKQSPSVKNDCRYIAAVSFLAISAVMPKAKLRLILAA